MRVTPHHVHVRYTCDQNQPGSFSFSRPRLILRIIGSYVIEGTWERGYQNQGVLNKTLNMYAYVHELEMHTKLTVVNWLIIVICWTGQYNVRRRII